MVEPIKPVLRNALKAEHVGLTDDVIDELEELTQLRFELDPESDAAELEARRAKILDEYMPKYRKVCDELEGQGA